jgi:hypothetical protein
MSQHVLPPLPYDYDALEPYISKQIMELHHKKHHQTYVTALNTAEAAYAKSSSAKERIALQAALKFNGGGVCDLSSRSTIRLYLFSRSHQPLFVLEKLGSFWFQRRTRRAVEAWSFAGRN